MKTEIPQVYAYLRVSGHAQVKGDGFRRQEAAIRDFAYKQGLKITRVFKDKGVSGTTHAIARPALSELISLTLSGHVKAIVIERLDRLARDLMVQETILADLAKLHVTVLSVSEPDLCSTDPSRKLTRQIFGAIAEYDKAMIVLKLRAARQRKRETTGRCEGRKPFGFVAGENAVIERICKLRRDGYSVNNIAQELNDAKVPSRTGSIWYPASVSRMVKRHHQSRLPPSPVCDAREAERKRRSVLRYWRIGQKKKALMEAEVVNRQG